MALEKSGDILRDAYKNKTGVVAFNVLNYDMIRLAIQKAEELHKPLLVACYPGFKDMISIEAVAKIVKLCARDVKVPVGLHLDHSSDYAELIQAMHMGYSSVMYDGSMLSFEENAKNTAEVVKVAKTLGIDVEAELGFVGDAGQLSDFADTDGFTSSDEALLFVEKTGCSSLAVAVGNAHGNYVQEPKLDLDLIDAINKKVGIPLVLHGGSGIPDDQVKEAVKRGIAKMNLGTELFISYFASLEANKISKKRVFDMLAAHQLVQKDVLNLVENKINLLCTR